MNTEHINALLSLSSLALLCVLAFPLYFELRTDVFRQNMFRIRDEFFDAALQAGLSHDDPAYGMVRSTMNGFIRFGHKVNIFQFILMVAFKSRIKPIDGSKSFQSRLNKNVDALSPAHKEIVLHYFTAVNECLLDHLIKSSPIFLVFVLLPASLWAKLRRYIHERRDARGAIDSLDGIALINGEMRTC